jgi:uncharacterized membrane protein YedE/YeeE
MFSLLEEYEIYKIVNILGFVLGLMFGAVAQKCQFCFSGSIKDFMLTNSTKRGASVVVAMIVVIVATTFIAYINEIDLTATNFYKDNVNYFTIVLGGAIFGAGMIIADGCSSRHLIKFAQGDNHSLVTLIFIGIFAYVTTKGILYAPLQLVTQNETLLDLSSSIGNFTLSLWFILPLLLIILWFLIGKKLSRVLSLSDGLFVGLFISIGWYITGVIGADAMERSISLTSMTFVYPTAQTLELFTQYELYNLTFGISIILGILVGAFAMSRFNRRYSFGCTSNIKRNKLGYNMVGGAMMGVGGVLAIGCTVGQGLTGLSTLAFASFVAISSIMISGFITAIFLKRKDKLPMCFVFDWEDDCKVSR